MIDEAALVAWGERVFRFARHRGWDVADAEDIRQAALLQCLKEGRPPPRLLFAYLNARAAVRPLRERGFVPLADPPRAVSPLDAQLDASTYLASLPKGDAHLLRRWMAGEEPTDMRRKDQTARRRALARYRILGTLRRRPA